MPRRTENRLTKRTVEDADPSSFIWDSEVPGFGVRVTTRGTRSFVFQFRTRSGQQGKITIGSFPSMTVDQARRHARQHRARVDEGGNPSAERAGAREAASVSDLSEFYCKDYAATRNLKEQTVKDARRLLNRYVLPKAGRKKVHEITVADIRTIHGDARRGSGRYEANRLRACLSRMFTLAIQNGWRSDNPCKGVEKFHEDQRWNYLSRDQVTFAPTPVAAFPPSGTW